MGDNIVERCNRAQESFCDEYNFPMFAPSNGICFRCGQQIYTDDENSYGITISEASNHLITNCPWCGRSYCD